MDKKTLEIQIKLLANQALSQVKEFSADIQNAAQKAKGFTGDSKSVAASIKSMQSEAQRAATQLKLFGLNSSDLRNTQQNLKKTILDLVDGGLKPESKEVQNLVEKYKELDKQASKVEASEQGLFGILGKLKNEIGSLAVVAAAVKVDRMVGDLAKSTLDVNNSFQKVKDEFGIMLGDVEAGIGLFNELQEFNFWTPFDIEQTSQAAKVLISAKVPLQEVTQYLTKFGDIAQGDSQKFQSYINAFSKASAKGKADMEVLNVYTDQGVQILDALGQQMGKTSAEIVKMASEGKIGFEDLDSALQALASDGGLYYGTMEKAAMRLDAVQAGLEESVKSLKASFGQMLAPAIAKVLTVITDLVDKINSSPILKGALAAAIAAVTVAVNALAGIAIVKLISSLKLATVAVAGLGTAINTALPIIGAITVAVGLITAAFVSQASAQQKAADAAAEHALKMKELDKAYKDYLATANMAEAMTAAQNYSMLEVKQKTTVSNLKTKLENTPQKIQKSQNGYKYEAANPEYAKLQTQLKEAEALLADYQQKRQAASQRIEQIQKEEQKKIADHVAKMKEAVKKLGTEWQDKLAESNAGSDVEKLQLEQQQALEKLSEKAASIYEGDINQWAAYQKEKAALAEYYNKKIADKIKEETESARTVIQKWIDKGDPVGALERQKADALKALDESANKLYGDSYKTAAKYIAANAALEMEYNEKIADEKKRLAKEGAEEAKRLTLSQEVATSAQNATQGTDVGTIVDTLKNGGSIWGALISILMKAVGSLESFQKGMNMITEALKKVFTRIEPLLKKAMDSIDDIIGALADALTPILAIIVALSNEFTKLIFQMLKPLFNIIEKIAYVLIELYNQILVPISQVVADILNIIIGLINDVFGAGLDEIKAFDKIIIATEALSDEIEKQQEMLKKKYQRMQNAVKEQLDSQLATLKSQYELGLISREQYQKQAEKYASEADEKIYDIEQEMNKKLEDIKNNTKDTSTSTEKTKDEAEKSNTKLDNTNFNLGNITGAISKINEFVTSSISSVTSSISSVTSSISSVTSSITNSTTSVISSVTGSITGLTYTVTSSIGNVISSVTHSITSLSDAITGSITSAISDITSLISGITSSITTLSSAITDSITEIIRAITKVTTGLLGLGGGSGSGVSLPGLGSIPIPGVSIDPVSVTPGLSGIGDTIIGGVSSGDWERAGIGLATGGLVDTEDEWWENGLNVVTGGLYDVGKKAWEGVKDFFGWDVGSWSIPEDQMAMVHQGEIIVPRTFSDGIRSGELTLSHNGNSGETTAPIYVTVNVGGSVLAENELVDTVYSGLVRGIEKRKYAPLGAA